MATWMENHIWATFVSTHSIEFDLHNNKTQRNNIGDEMTNSINCARDETKDYSVWYREASVLQLSPYINPVNAMKYHVDLMVRYRNDQLWHDVDSVLNELIQSKVREIVRRTSNIYNPNLVLNYIGNVTAIPTTNQSSSSISNESSSLNQLVSNVTNVASSSYESKVVSFPNVQCAICLDRCPTHVFVPCGHLVCCSECLASVKTECPMCRKLFSEAIRVFV